MEDISTLIWLGIAIVWFLTRLIRRGVKKAAGGEPQQQRQRQRPTVSRPAAPPTEPRPFASGGGSDFSGRGGTGPPPIVPR